MADEWEENKIVRDEWDEEDDSDVMDDWEAALSDEEEGEGDKEDKADTTKKAKESPAAPVKKKRTVAQAIRARVAEKEKEQQQQQNDEEDAEPVETALQRKLRIEKEIMDADMENAKDLFGVDDSVVIEDARKEPEIDFASYRPANKLQYEKFAQFIATKLTSFKPTSNYVTFLEKLIRAAADPLEHSDIRKLSGMLNTLSNDKQRAAKDKGKKKGKKGPTLKAAAGDIDLGAYGDEALDDEFADFM